MIRRIDRIQTELPPPSDPDPAGAAAVQELLGGKFGEMSTFLNYTFQSFNFRNKQGARPFYDLVANIAAEEFGHVELVAKTINTMLTGATQTTTPNGRGPGSPLKGLKLAWEIRITFSSAARARCRRTSGSALERRLRVLLRRSRRGPDPQLLPGDGRQERKAEGLRDGRASGRASAHRLSARAWRRPPGRLRTRGRASNRRQPDEDVPGSSDPDGEDPGVQAAHQARRAPEALPLFPKRLSRARGCVQGATPGDGRGIGSRRGGAGRRSRLRPPSQPAVFAPDYAPEEIAAIAEKLRKQAGLPKSPSGEVANGNGSTASKPRRATRKPKAAAKK